MKFCEGGYIPQGYLHDRINKMPFMGCIYACMTKEQAKILGFNIGDRIVKVVSRGTPPEIANYTASCGKCHSVLEFQKSEAQVKVDRNETVYVLNCPVCRNDIWIASLALKPSFHQEAQSLDKIHGTDFRDRPFNPK